MQSKNINGLCYANVNSWTACLLLYYALKQRNRDWSIISKMDVWMEIDLFSNLISFSCKSFLFRFSSPLTLWNNIWFKIQWLHHIVVEIYFHIFIIIFIFSGHPLQNEEQYSYDDPSDYDYGDDEEIEEEKEISYDVNFMNSGETLHVDKGTTIRLPCYIDTFPGKTISNYYLLTSNNLK